MASLPRTVEAAVDQILAWPTMDGDTIDLIRGLDESDVCELHFSLGMSVRNDLRLWERTSPLLQACGTADADEASHVILLAVRARLMKTATEADLQRAAESRAARQDERRCLMQRIAARDARITALRCPYCGQPCPNYRLTCKHCRKTVGRQRRAGDAT